MGRHLLSRQYRGPFFQPKSVKECRLCFAAQQLSRYSPSDSGKDESFEMAESVSEGCAFFLARLQHLLEAGAVNVGMKAERETYPTISKRSVTLKNRRTMSCDMA